ncbi:MAG: hypothetical protein BJ554DRAFT_8108 [Olpidium bornovanus]|uniref:Uncharacterized protein n=1 Tax=Olpidium bornovanus TaxID=278681 RepID=A0A8H7ZUJ9_9FUNG|nr:MAG: hypothetical protein BJ554DRAFT_8108 [Olpidium bornovanus]
MFAMVAVEEVVQMPAGKVVDRGRGRRCPALPELEALVPGARHDRLAVGRDGRVQHASVVGGDGGQGGQRRVGVHAHGVLVRLVRCRRRRRRRRRSR